MSPKVKKTSEGDLIVMPLKEFEDLIEEASRRGAGKALKRVGLDDEQAGLDIRDLRDFLKALRIAKKDAFNVFVKWFVVGILTLITAGFISLMGNHLNIK
ncbi:MAG: hypothetical protein EOM53_04345 [Alphaproteobacteria bacterium]|nr:hypothetical protein [Alphaproteobacteria bacterium]